MWRRRAQWAGLVVVWRQPTLAPPTAVLLPLLPLVVAGWAGSWQQRAAQAAAGQQQQLA